MKPILTILFSIALIQCIAQTHQIDSVLSEIDAREDRSRREWNITMIGVVVAIAAHAAASRKWPAATFWKRTALLGIVLGMIWYAFLVLENFTTYTHPVPIAVQALVTGLLVSLMGGAIFQLGSRITSATRR